MEKQSSSSSVRTRGDEEKQEDRRAKFGLCRKVKCCTRSTRMQNVSQMQFKKMSKKLEHRRDILVRSAKGERIAVLCSST